MKKLLNFEFRKLFRQKSFYVCNVLLLIFVFLSAAISKLIAENAEDVSYRLPTVADTLRSALQGANVTLIAGIFTALFVCADYSDGTLKNIYAKGYTRTSVYFSKLTAVLVSAAFFCVVTWGSGFLYGKFLFKVGGDLNIGLFGILAAQFFTVFGYTGLFFALAMIIKKTGGSIAACIVGPMLFSLLFTTANTVINSRSLNLSDYWLDGLFGNLAQIGVSGEAVLIAIALSIVYAAVFTIIGVLFNKRQVV